MARMFKRLALLADEAGDGDEGGGGGAPAGGSPEGGSGKPKDDLVPASRLAAALQDQERRLRAEFEAKLAEKAKPADQPKAYTRAELQALVDEGKITQAQADEEIDRQRDARAVHVAQEVVAAGKRGEKVDAEIARYTAVAPELLDDDHETRKAVRAAYKDLVDLGDNPKDVATQLKAIRQVLGPIDRLERARNGRSQHEHHRETGGDGGGGGGSRKTGKPSEQLNADSKRYYQAQIDKGIYKGWDDVDAELKYASPSTKRRLGIAA